jgi:hypothetical protein
MLENRISAQISEKIAKELDNPSKSYNIWVKHFSELNP